jgi:hypothetical protein
MWGLGVVAPGPFRYPAVATTAGGLARNGRNHAAPGARVLADHELQVVQVETSGVQSVEQAVQRGGNPWRQRVGIGLCSERRSLLQRLAQRRLERRWRGANRVRRFLVCERRRASSVVAFLRGVRFCARVLPNSVVSDSDPDSAVADLCEDGAFARLAQAPASRRREVIQLAPQREWHHPIIVERTLARAAAMYLFE